MGYYGSGSAAVKKPTRGKRSYGERADENQALATHALALRRELDEARRHYKL